MTSLSPALTKNGTLTINPVSILAGLEPPEAVSPLIPGSVSSTVNVTVLGKETPNVSCPYIIK